MALVSGTPAPWRFMELPVMASDPSVMPWKALVKLTTESRPVTLRASFSAASTEFVPVGPGNITLWSSPRGASTTSWNRSRNSPLAAVWASRLWVIPSRVRYSMRACFWGSGLWP